MKTRDVLIFSFVHIFIYFLICLNSISKAHLVLLGPIKTLKAKQHWLRIEIERETPLDLLAKVPKVWRYLVHVKVCCTVICLTSRISRRAAEAGYPSFSWKTKIGMASLRTTLRHDSQTVHNSLMCSCIPTLNPTAYLY